MKETVEHNNRFYTNEKGEIKTENEQLKEWLIIANKENERLKEELKYTVPVVEYNKTITKHIKEKEQLHSIIKEVREKILSVQIPYLGLRSGKTLIATLLNDILKILDKENSNE